MSEEFIPDVEMTSDVVESNVNYSEMTLAELVQAFEQLAANEERMKMLKEAEAIKAAFYRRLLKEKADAGIVTVAAVEEDAQEEEVGPQEQAEEESAVQVQESVSDNPFDEIEKGFKNLYNKYKKERAEYNRQLEKEREDNLVKKQAVIEDLKALLDKQEDVNATFPEFREIQNRWRAIGPVPMQNNRNNNER